MGLLWIKAQEMRTGHANVIGHLDPVLDAAGIGRSRPVAARVTITCRLADAPEAYALYDRREALKIVLNP